MQGIKLILKRMRYRLPQQLANTVLDDELLFYLNESNRWLVRKITIDLPEVLAETAVVMFNETGNIILPLDCLKVLDLFLASEARSIKDTGAIFTLVSKSELKITPALDNKQKYLIKFVRNITDYSGDENSSSWSMDCEEILEKYAIMLFKQGRMDIKPDMAQLSEILNELKLIINCAVPSQNILNLN